MATLGPAPVRDRVTQRGTGLLTESWRQWITQLEAKVGLGAPADSTLGPVLPNVPPRVGGEQALWLASNGQVRVGAIASTDLPLIPESKISNGSLLARVADPETITGAWTFVQTPHWPAQAAATVYAGPASGAAAAPTFRALTDADVPDTLTLTQVLGPRMDVAGQVVVGGALTVTSGEVRSPGALRTRADGGALTLSSAGDVYLDPDGNFVLPSRHYQVTLGQPEMKLRALWCGELFVETLVAQETIATIGGRIVVAPTTSLTADLAPGATTITVKHNSAQIGDTLYMEARGVSEYLRVTDGPTGTDGLWEYTVERDKDGGFGSHQWFAGDAVLNTGQAGQGFIDLYSLRGIKSIAERGPTVVGNVRTASTTSSSDPLVNQYQAWEPRWAIGHLEGLYGQTAGTFGAAFGVPSGRHALYTANEVRFRDGAATRLKLDGTGLVLYDGAGVERVIIGANAATFTGSVTITGGSGFGNLTDRPTSLSDINTGEGTKLAGIEAGATVGATWGTNLSGIPTTLQAPSGNGLYLSSTHMGFYQSGQWRSYLQNDGRFRFYGAAGHSIEWDGTTLAIAGAISITSGSGYGNLSDRPTTLSAINSSEGTKLSGIEAGATVGATWGTNLSGIPTTLQAPTGNGLYLSSTHMGFYENGDWRTYIRNNGHFRFYGAAGHSIEWNGTTLTVAGSIAITSGSGYGNLSDRPTNLSAINSSEGSKLAGIEAGATVGANWSTNVSNRPTELTDGRVSAGLNSSGDVRRVLSSANIAAGSAVTGLNLTSTHLGYYNGSTWTAFIQNNGSFTFGHPSDANKRIVYDSVTGTLTIRGSLVADDITSGIITGITVRTGASGARTEMGAGGITCFDTNGDGASMLTPSGMYFWSASNPNDYARTIQFGYPTAYGRMFANSSNYVVSSASGAALTVEGAAGTTVRSFVNTVVLHAGTASTFQTLLTLNSGDPTRTIDLVADIVQGGSDQTVTLGSASKRFKNIHLSLPAASSPNYAVVGKTTGSSDLGYLAGWSGTLSVRKGDDSGEWTLTIQTGIITNVS